MMKLDKQSIENLLVGAKITGAGGGGKMKWTRPLIKEVFEKGKNIVLVDPKEVLDDKIIIISSSISGGIAKEIKSILEGYRSFYEMPRVYSV